MTRATNTSRFLAILATTTALLAAAQFASPPPAAPGANTGRMETRLSTTPSRIIPVDRIVAVVNDEVLTYNDLNERVQLVIRQIQRQGGQLPAADLLQRQILERMINDVVQAQMAKETGIKVDDPTLDRTIDRISQENNMNAADFRKALERDG
ncbi:MAG: SurA N-terminal domain-containing protein, partial [Usitatibacter sp.]